MPSLGTTLAHRLEAARTGARLVPGHLFFVRAVSLPPEVKGAEINGFVELTLEGLAPFPLEQLAWGYFHHPEEPRVVMYAAFRESLRTRYGLGDLEEPVALYPDFLAALSPEAGPARVRFLLYEDSLSALVFEEDRLLPSTVKCLRIPTGAPEGDEGEDAPQISAEALFHARESLLRTLRLPEGYAVEETTEEAAEPLLQPDRAVLLRTRFWDEERVEEAVAQAEDLLPASGEESPAGETTETPPPEVSTDEEEAAAEETEEDTVPDAATHWSEREAASLGLDLWAADIRDARWVQRARQQQRISGVLWKALLGAAAVLLLLLVGQGVYWGLRGWLGQREARIAERQPAVAEVQARSARVDRIEQFVQADLRPFEMLALANARRPSGIYFTRVTSEEANTLRIEGEAVGEAGEVNAYAEALRTAAGVEAAETEDVRIRQGRAQFTLLLRFALPGKPAEPVTLNRP